jgi:hypothetical protein
MCKRYFLNDKTLIYFMLNALNAYICFNFHRIREQIALYTDFRFKKSENRRMNTSADVLNSKFHHFSV